MKHFTDARQITDTITGLPDVDQEYSGFYSVLPHYYAKNVHWQTNYSDGSSFGATVTTAHTALMLFTGGKAGVHQLNLIQLQCSGVKYGAPSGTLGWPWLGMETTTIDPSTMRAFGQPVGADGNLWVMEPDNAALDLNLTAPGEHYGAWVTPTKYELVHQTLYPALTDTNLARLNLGVGEQVNLSIQPALPTGYIPVWSASAGGFSSRFVNNPTFTAPSNAATAVISLEVMTAIITNAITFNVLEPSGIDHAIIVATNHLGDGLGDDPPDGFATNKAGAEMQLNVYIAPTYVSFYNVQIMEVGENATSVTGYFTNNPPFTTSLLHHNPNPDFTFLGADNSWPDSCWEGPEQDPPPAWSSGSYTWVVPVKWSLSPSTVTNSMTGWNQVFTIDSSGTEKITKYGKWVQRTINNVITNN